MLSPDIIKNPQSIGKHINLPFYHGHRYAAVPGSGINDMVEVDICPKRPEYLIYHDHCLHLMDLKVNLFFLILSFYLILLLQVPQDIQFGNVEEDSNVNIGSPLPISSSAKNVEVLTLFVVLKLCTNYLSDIPRFPVWYCG